MILNNDRSTKIIYTFSSKADMQEISQRFAGQSLSGSQPPCDSFVANLQHVDISVWFFGLDLKLPALKLHPYVTYSHLLFTRKQNHIIGI